MGLSDGANNQAMPLSEQVNNLGLFDKMMDKSYLS